MSAVTEPSCVESSGCSSSQSLLAREASDDESSLYEDDLEEMSEYIICMFFLFGSSLEFVSQCSKCKSRVYSGCVCV